MSDIKQAATHDTEPRPESGLEARQQNERPQEQEPDVSGHSLLHERVFVDAAASRTRDADTWARNHQLTRTNRRTRLDRILRRGDDK